MKYTAAQTNYRDMMVVEVALLWWWDVCTTEIWCWSAGKQDRRKGKYGTVCRHSNNSKANMVLAKIKHNRSATKAHCTKKGSDVLEHRHEIQAAYTKTIVIAMGARKDNRKIDNITGNRQ